MRNRCAKIKIMPLNILQQSTCLPRICPLSELKYAPLLNERLHWRSPVPCVGSVPVLRRFSYTAGTTNLRSSAFICGSFFAEAPCINCSGFIKISTYQNFAFSEASKLTPQSTPRAQSVHKPINKATETTKITTPPVSGRINIHPQITIMHQRCEYFHIPLQEYNSKLTNP